jgi:hypothetical protein
MEEHMAQTIQDIFDEFEELDLLEDRREYNAEDYQHAYGLTEQEAQDLKYLVQREFDPNIPQIALDEIPANIIKEYLDESENQGFEGFNEHETIVILKLFDDMKRYYKALNSK